ncbi:site-specific integrase [Microvirga rosea]|uniref:site-specific integrase n=1 Tax=Microvirga rosea TaxID=2715425 RepID=UPI001D0A1716|nr:site-specific integrase [Microvirga rosea]MCB8819547.1 site-specific integrase [Microvirga rosea]
MPTDSRPRLKRLIDGDEAKLLGALNSRSAWYLRHLIALAIETGMRRGELLSILWRDLDEAARTLTLRTTKNGHPRTIPLTAEALRVLGEIPRTTERVFPVTPNAVRLAWERLVTRAGVGDLRLHDLRHEAISRFFEMGLSVPEVALISGHRDPRMLFRYTHPRPEDIAQKLAANS